MRADGERWIASIVTPARGDVSLRTVVPGAVDQTLIGAYRVL